MAVGTLGYAAAGRGGLRRLSARPVALAAAEDPTDRRVAAAGDRVVSFIGRRATGAEGYTVRDGG
ncbi:hypothetical protein ACHZ98_03825 [Streptomyces sp. MAR4 CNY-716]